MSYKQCCNQHVPNYITWKLGGRDMLIYCLTIGGIVNNIARFYYVMGHGAKHSLVSCFFVFFIVVEYINNCTPF